MATSATPPEQPSPATGGASFSDTKSFAIAAGLVLLYSLGHVVLSGERRTLGLEVVHPHISAERALAEGIRFAVKILPYVACALLLGNSLMRFGGAFKSWQRLRTWVGLQERKHRFVITSTLASAAMMLFYSRYVLAGFRGYAITQHKPPAWYQGRVLADVLAEERWWTWPPFFNFALGPLVMGFLSLAVFLITWLLIRLANCLGRLTGKPASQISYNPQRFRWAVAVWTLSYLLSVATLTGVMNTRDMRPVIAIDGLYADISDLCSDGWLLESGTAGTTVLVWDRKVRQRKLLHFSAPPDRPLIVTKWDAVYYSGCNGTHRQPPTPPNPPVKMSGP